MIGTPRSLAALRWSPARMPRPPEYCGSTSVMPNSGEKYAMQRGTGRSGVPALWYQRGPERYSCRSSAASDRRREELSIASQRLEALGRHRAEQPARVAALLGPHLGVDLGSNRSRVSGCHDQRRLSTSSASGWSGAGSTARTVKRRRALTRPRLPPVRAPTSVRSIPMIGRIPITDVEPVVSCGRYPAKAVVGEEFTIAATVFREGHDAVAANVVLTDPTGRDGPFSPMHAG